MSRFLTISPSFLLILRGKPYERPYAQETIERKNQPSSPGSGLPNTLPKTQPWEPCKKLPCWPLGARLSLSIRSQRNNLTEQSGNIWRGVRSEVRSEGNHG